MAGEARQSTNPNHRLKKTCHLQEITYSRKKKQQELDRTKQDVLSDKIPSMVADSGATSSCGRVNDPFNQTGLPSTKLFHTPLGQMAQALETENFITWRTSMNSGLSHRTTTQFPPKC